MRQLFFGSFGAQGIVQYIVADNPLVGQNIRRHVEYIAQLSVHQLAELVHCAYASFGGAIEQNPVRRRVKQNQPLLLRLVCKSMPFSSTNRELPILHIIMQFNKLTVSFHVSQPQIGINVLFRKKWNALSKQYGRNGDNHFINEFIMQQTCV